AWTATDCNLGAGLIAPPETTAPAVVASWTNLRPTLLIGSESFIAPGEVLPTTVTGPKSGVALKRDTSWSIHAFRVTDWLTSLGSAGNCATTWRYSLFCAFVKSICEEMTSNGSWTG